MEQLAGLLEQLEAAEIAPPAERREHPRTPAYDKVPVAVEIPGRPAIHGTLRDISKSGLGLTLPHPLPPGTQFTFRSALAHKSVRALCHVANCRPTPDGRHHIIGARIIPATRPTTAPPVANAPANPHCHAPQPTAADIDQQHLADVRRRLAAAVNRC